MWNEVVIKLKNKEVLFYIEKDMISILVNKKAGKWNRLRNLSKILRPCSVQSTMPSLNSRYCWSLPQFPLYRPVHKSHSCRKCRLLKSQNISLFWKLSFGLMRLTLIYYPCATMDCPWSWNYTVGSANYWLNLSVSLLMAGQ